MRMRTLVSTAALTVATLTPNNAAVALDNALAIIGKGERHWGVHDTGLRKCDLLSRGRRSRDPCAPGLP